MIGLKHLVKSGSIVFRNGRKMKGLQQSGTGDKFKKCLNKVSEGRNHN